MAEQIRTDTIQTKNSLALEKGNSSIDVGATLGLTNKKGRKLRPLLFGGDEEDRTPDLRIANATLSQLSYVPVVLWRSGSRQAP